ncbi:hypothetical protein D3C78_1321280 [compost metagenome]
MPVSPSWRAICRRRDSLRSFDKSTRPREYIITVTVPMLTEMVCFRLLTSYCISVAPPARMAMTRRVRPIRLMPPPMISSM